jgi:hypothetical protein
MRNEGPGAPEADDAGVERFPQALNQLARGGRAWLLRPPTKFLAEYRFINVFK